MKAVAVIPARYASTRFPGKPLADETGKYLIQHVYEQVAQARSIAEVIVATDDDRIFKAVQLFNGRVAMTRPDHPSGTDRVAEVAEGLDADMIVNVQGDEPEIDPTQIDKLVALLAKNPEVPVGTLACPFPPDADPTDPNAVKVVLDIRGRALFFSRSLIPYPRDAASKSLSRDCDTGVSPVTKHRRDAGATRMSDATGMSDAAGGLERGSKPTAAGHSIVPDDPSRWLLHLGIYAYRRAFLLELAKLPPTPLEQREKLEQLRILEHGHTIAVAVVDRAAIGIDTPEDYAAFVQRQTG